MTEQRNNAGSIRVNKDKQKPTHKDYTGKVVIDGKGYFVAGWKKERDGETWLSLEFTPIQEPTL